jgi:hypothetical protein
LLLCPIRFDRIMWLKRWFLGYTAGLMVRARAALPDLGFRSGSRVGHDCGV